MASKYSLQGKNPTKTKHKHTTYKVNTTNDKYRPQPEPQTTLKIQYNQHSKKGEPRMTEFLDTSELHKLMKERIRDSTPAELRNNAQRERVESDIDGQIRELRLKFKVGTNGHAIVDAKNKSIKAVTYNHETNTQDLDITEKTREENKEEIQTLDRVAELMEMSYRQNRGENR